MATVTMAQLAARIELLTSAFQAAVSETTVAAGISPRKVKVLDIKKREQVIEPARIFYMAAVDAKGDQPNTVFDATICLFAAVDDGKLLRCILPGTPQAVALQLGLGFEVIHLAPPPLRTVAQTVADAQAAINNLDPIEIYDLAGKTLADSPAVIVASPGKTTLSITHAETFGKLSHWRGYRLADGAKLSAAVIATRSMPVWRDMMPPISLVA